MKRLSKTPGYPQIHRLLSLVLAIYFLNFSFDSPDAQPDHISENLSHNDIESFYEFILEELLGLDNAVEEHDEQDQEDSRSIEFSKYYANALSFDLPQNLIRPSKCLIGYQPDFFSNSFFEIDSPPPRS